MIKQLTILTLALGMLSVSGIDVQAGLFDRLTGTKTTTGNPAGYGRIVRQQNGSQDSPARLASLKQSGPQLAPGEFLVPDPEGDFPPPAPDGYDLPPAEPIGLYPHVRYKNLHEMHPYPVKMIVQVKDPCPPPRDLCNHCQPEPRFVLVEICVPPCGYKKVKVSRGGRKVKYDFGKYEVKIESKKGVVYVKYDD